MKKILSLITSLVLMVSLAGCGATSQSTDQVKSSATAAQKEITISAAASLKDSLTEIQKLYTQKNPGIKLTFNFGASGTLQQQIEQGAPADLFISAGKSQVDALEAKNLTIKESRVNLLNNTLVLVVGKDNAKITAIQDLAKSDVKQISIGTPESVPAGKYAKESLTNLKLWDALQSKMVLAKDVTQVLNYVETGNVDAGFVYASDAKGSTKTKVVAAAPKDSHSAIVYPAAIVTSTKNKAETEAFLKYLQSSEAQQIFANYGFEKVTK